MRRFDIVAPSIPSKANNIGRRNYSIHKSVTYAQDNTFTVEQIVAHTFVGLNLFPVSLAMPIKNALLPAQISVDIHILTTPLPVHGLILEIVLEAVLCPVVDITCIEVYFAGDDDVNMFEKCKI